MYRELPLTTSSESFSDRGLSPGETTQVKESCESDPAGAHLDSFAEAIALMLPSREYGGGETLIETMEEGEALPLLDEWQAPTVLPGSWWQ